MCHVSHVTCHMSWWNQSVEGLLSMRLPCLVSITVCFTKHTSIINFLQNDTSQNKFTSFQQYLVTVLHLHSTLLIPSLLLLLNKEQCKLSVYVVMYSTKQLAVQYKLSPSRWRRHSPQRGRVSPRTPCRPWRRDTSTAWRVGCCTPCNVHCNYTIHGTLYT